MKIVAIICNVVLFLFICLVLATDGFPGKALYVVFTLWSLMTPVFNFMVISRRGAREGGLNLPGKAEGTMERTKADGTSSAGAFVKIAAITANLVLFGFVCWAFADQYPHPKEDGFIAYLVMLLFVPILSAVVIFYGGAGNGRPGISVKNKMSRSRASVKPPPSSILEIR